MSQSNHKYQRPPCERRRRGAVMVLMMMVSVVTLVLGLSMMHASHLARVTAVRDTEKLKAQNAAEAGLKHAILQMNRKLSREMAWDNETLPSAAKTRLLASWAAFEYAVEGDATTGFRLTATGSAGQQQRTVHARLGVTSTIQGVTAQGRICTGPFGLNLLETLDPKRASDFVLRTNSTANSSIRVATLQPFEGSLVSGPGSNPDAVIDYYSGFLSMLLGREGKPAGGISAASEAVDLPSVEVPTYTKPLPSTAAPIPPGDYVVDGDLTLGQNQTLEITGPTRIYVDGAWNMLRSDLVIHPGASLDIVVDGDVFMGAVFDRHSYTDASQLTVNGTDNCHAINLLFTDFYGAIYAPNAEVNMGLTRATGAVAAREVNLGLCHLRYDTSLVDSLDIDDAFAIFVLNRWWED